MQIRKTSETATTSSSLLKKNPTIKAEDFSCALQKARITAESSLDALFQTAGQKFRLPPALLKAVAQVESGLNPQAVSRAGAQGLMQLMPATARSLGVQNAFDPAENIYGGAKYLRSLLDSYQGDIRLALAAYNAGPGAVAKYGDVPPFRETQAYLKKVLAAANDLSSLNKPLKQSTNHQDTPVRSEKLLAEGSNIPEWQQVWAAVLLARAALTINSSFEKLI